MITFVFLEPNFFIVLPIDCWRIPSLFKEMATGYYRADIICNLKRESLELAYIEYICVDRLTL